MGEGIAKYIYWPNIYPISFRQVRAKLTDMTIDPCEDYANVSARVEILRFLLHEIT